MSISQFILLGTWILEGNFKEKFNALKTNRILQAFLVLPFIHIIWLCNTTDFVYALHDLKIKIPLLLFPLILGTIAPFSFKEIKWVLNTFILAVFAGSMVSIAVFTGIYYVEYYDIRSISLFISHIRFGLMVVLSLFLLGYFIIERSQSYSNIQKILLSLLMLWFLAFLVILQSITSWVAVTVLVIFFLARYLKYVKNKITRVLIWLFIIGSFIGGVALFAKVYSDFYHTETYDLSKLPLTTKQGNKYYHKVNPKLKENGHYINILICSKELKETWPMVSELPLNNKDANNYTIKSTLIRYLTSKGLTKDAEGILALDEEDIRLIENGHASCVYRVKFIPYVKIYNLIWEVDRYIKLNDPNNKSIVQRFEFNKAAFHIIGTNFWFGIGTGDLKEAYKNAYIDIKSNLKEKNRLRAHNQFVTFMVTFGIFGFILAMFSMLYPALAKTKSHFLISSFITLIFISMLNEDTLETQAGVTFYISIYTLLIFSNLTSND